MRAGDVGKARAPHYSRGIRQVALRTPPLPDTLLLMAMCCACCTVFPHAPLASLTGLPTGQSRFSQQCCACPQALYKLATEGDWAARYSMFVGAPADIPGDYGKLLARAKFCLLAPGQQSRSLHTDKLCSAATTQHLHAPSLSGA